jgi:hypothetical protein
VLHHSATIEAGEDIAQLASGLGIVLELIEDLAPRPRCQGFENLFFVELS